MRKMIGDSGSAIGAWIAIFVLPILVTGCGGSGGGGGGGGIGGVNNVAEGQMGGAIQKNPLVLGGVVTTPVGTFNGTDGSVDGARFRVPSALTRDTASGDIFVADGCEIRLVDLDDQVHTVAGQRQVCNYADATNGTSAKFTAIGGMDINDTYIYLTDQNRIRRVLRAAPHTVDTLAGDASPGYLDANGLTARFNAPQGVASNGIALYVADTGNHTIRAVNIFNNDYGDVVTVVGSAGLPGNVNGLTTSARVDAPTALAVCGTKLYFADGHGVRIRRADLSWVYNEGVVAVAGGNTVGNSDGDGAAASFGEVAGLACNASNTTLYVADRGNQRIRTVDISGTAMTVHTLAGTAFGEADSTANFAAASFAFPSGIVTNGVSLTVADSIGATLRKVAVTDGAVTTYAGTPRWKDGVGAAASFGAGTHVVTDGKNLYIADLENSVIRKVIIATGEVSTLAGAPGILGNTDGTGADARFYFPFAITTDGINLYATEPLAGTIRKINIASGKVTTLVAGGLLGAAGITTDNKDLYVTVPSRHVVYKVDMDGTVSLFAGKVDVAGDLAATRADTRFTSPNAITTDGKTLFLVDDSLHKLVQLSLTEDSVSLFLAGPTDIKSMVADGRSLYVSAGSGVGRIDIATKVLAVVAGASAGYSDAVGASARFGSGLGLTSDGTSLFVYDGINGVIRKIQ